jgi:TfoX/Sxy family transcriptional regulator of competence genes
VAYDETLAATLRAALDGRGSVSERKMFGGLCFMIDGNMLCGTYRDRGMVRVGKSNAEAALALPHTRPMAMTGRPMPGLVEIDREAILDPDLRERLLALAFDFVASLPPKEVRTAPAASARRRSPP